MGLSDKSGLFKDMKKHLPRTKKCLSRRRRGRRLRADRGGDEEVEETHSEEIFEAISL